MNVAVYSGSFNPLHIGHLAIIRHLIEVAGFDMVYLIVSPKNPLKGGISSETGKDRYNAAIEAVNRHFSNDTEGKVFVDDIELNFKKESLRTSSPSSWVQTISLTSADGVNMKTF